MSQHGGSGLSSSTLGGGLNLDPDPLQWSVANVVVWAEQEGLVKFVQVLHEHDIDG
jgi:hypothetical protein